MTYKLLGLDIMNLKTDIIDHTIHNRICAAEINQNRFVYIDDFTFNKIAHELCVSPQDTSELRLKKNQSFVK